MPISTGRGARGETLKSAADTVEAMRVSPCGIRLILGTGILTAFAASTGVALGAPSITEFPVTVKNHGPLGVAAGPDGNTWFTEGKSSAIGSITPSGSITEFTSGISGRTESITTGPDGNLWFTEPKEETIGKITPTGSVNEYSVNQGPPATPTQIVAGPDGNIWFTVPSGVGAIGRITTTGSVTYFSVGLTPNAKPTGLAVGPDGNLWFTEAANPARIGRITTTGTITEFAAGLTASSQPRWITAGPDGNLWFTESTNPGRIGRISPGGAVSEFTSGLTPNSQPEGIVAGTDGALYFTEAANPGRIGRITPAGTISELAVPTAGKQPEAITSGPDGNIWFTEFGDPGEIGMLTVAPGVGSALAPVVSEQSAVVKAPIRANAQPTTYYFQYGATLTYGSQTPATSAGSGAAAVTVEAPLSGLRGGSTYHLRAVATNASGTSYGPDTSFVTISPPAIVSQTASNVTMTGAELRGTVNPDSRATTYHFQWGTTSSYGSRVPLSDAAVGADSSEHAVAQSLIALTPDTSYHFRVVASNCGGCAEGTTYGPDEIFTTAPPPLAETQGATSVGTSSASVAGAVNPRGVAATYHFDYGPTAAYGSRSPAAELSAGADSNLHLLTQSLSALIPGADYHYRIVATNCAGCAAGTSHGNDATFVTLALPTYQLVASMPGAAGAAPPRLARTALVSAISGRVLVRAPGARTAVALAGATDIQVGSLVDASNGIVALATATDTAGHTQSATLWAGAFVVSQSAVRHGMTTFTLPGAPRCARRGRVAATASTRRRPALGLWAKDNHGSFSTRGQNSVATVRGTWWQTVDTCAGTVTLVRQGVVSVRDIHSHRTVNVRAGHRYLARR